MTPFNETEFVRSTISDKSIAFQQGFDAWLSGIPIHENFHSIVQDRRDFRAGWTLADTDPGVFKTIN